MLDKIINNGWQAWINTQPVQPTVGTLNVIGEIVTHPSRVAVLVKKVPQGINPAILLLEVVLHVSGTPTKQPQALRYVESLKALDQYKSIDVFNGAAHLATITEIPVIS